VTTIKRLKRSQVNSPKYWRENANNAQKGAERASNDKIKKVLLGFAEGYEKMAAVIEKSAAHKG